MATSENGTTNGTRSWNLQIQLWHVLLLLALQLLALGATYGSMKTSIDDTRKDVQRIDGQRTITKDEFDEWKKELIERMNRMETKIDEKLIRDNLR